MQLPRDMNCVYDVYLLVYVRVRGLLAEAEDDSARVDGELRAMATNLEVLPGHQRVAARFARIDAMGRAAARGMDDFCVTICESPCDLHPSRRGGGTTSTPARRN